MKKIFLSLIFICILANFCYADSGPIFYNNPRVFPNEAYSATCYPAGEVMNILPDNKCCPGLDEVKIVDEAQKDCNFVTGGVICSDCGNSVCDYGENICNCPEDCKEEMPIYDIPCSGTNEKTQTRLCGINVGECKKGIETRNCEAGEWGNWGNCEQAINPIPEICGNNKDDNCNNVVDDGCGSVRQTIQGAAIIQPNKKVASIETPIFIVIIVMIIFLVIFVINKLKKTFNKQN